MAKYANRKRNLANIFNMVDLVLVSSRNITLPHNLHKFNHRYYGPYKVAKQINQVTYQLELEDNMQLHNMFHVNLLKRFKPNTKYGHKIPVLQDGLNQFEPKAIL
ncbi:hypothetical protein KP509_1Z026200 [Ceratopteris richardii]|nr:hypothetical protein KP509_1Z026200 [Ceratopteris richardii]